MNTFWTKVEKTNQCWNWLGYTTPFGHGRLKVNGKLVYAHRYSWLMHNKRRINFFILHTCDNPKCVNPKHLYEGTKKQNTLDSINRGRHFESIKTHCEKGHLFSKENTLIYKRKRKCRICNKKRCLNYYYKQREKSWE